MAYLNTTTAPSIADRFSALSSALVARFRQHRAYRQTFNELSRLSDRELNDLGLSRGDIRRVAAETL